MAIQYFRAPDIEARVMRIAEKLALKHIDQRVICIRSLGTRSRYTLARVHPLAKIMQVALGVDPHYAIEVLSENFDCLHEDEKTKVLIHELLHIPKAFGGGLRGHRFVNSRKINQLFKRYNEPGEGCRSRPA